MAELKSFGNENGKLYWEDEDGNRHEFEATDVTIEYTAQEATTLDQSVFIPTSAGTVVTGICTGTSGIPVSLSYNTCAYKIEPNIDDILREAMLEHSPSQYDTDDDGTIYFGRDGSISVNCKLPCRNDIHIYVEKSDHNESADWAIKMLEEMKERIDDIQKRIFELSLNQGDGGEGECRS